MKILKVIFLVVSIFFIGCKENSKSEERFATLDSKVATSASVDMAMLAPPPPSSKIDEVQFVAPKITDKGNETIQSKIIKNANLRFETQDIEKTYESITSSCKKYKASVANDVVNNDDYAVSRSLTIRVPSANFDIFMVQLSKGVSYFDRKEISARDVTAEFIDNEVRIASKKALEKRYLQLLARATKISEMLELEKQLGTIREDIEAKEGQQKYLQNQVSMSTIEIEFYRNTPAQEGARVSFSLKIWNAIISGFNNISHFFILLISMWPFIIVSMAVIYYLRRRRKLRLNKA